MYGWNTQHQEFTLAKGDPTTIKQLITFAKLDGIVEFDESNKLITTTICHDRHIRLSDLLTLNVFYSTMQTTLIITFNLHQYFNVIVKLFSFLEKLKVKNVQHGNIKLENIVLDLSSSQYRLDINHQHISFDLKLINFAQFYGLPQQDDFFSICMIYSLILQKFPFIYQGNNLKLQIADYINEMNEIAKWQQNYYYAGEHFDQLRIKIKSIIYGQQIMKNYICRKIIEDLHRYYLIINHQEYQQQQQFDFEKPKEFRQACIITDQLIEIDIQQMQGIQKYLFNQNLNDEQIGQQVFLIKTTIQQQLIISIKQLGLLENIHKFVEIVNNYEQLNIIKQQLIGKYYVKPQEVKFNNIMYINDLPTEIQEDYIMSSQILKTMIQKPFMQNQTPSLNVLINKINDIKKKGQIYSKELIDHFINVYLSEQLKPKRLPNIEILTASMVRHWIKWVDQLIFNQQYIQIEQLDLINKDKYIQFIEGEGFGLLQVELKKFIEQVGDEIFRKLIK